MKKIILSLGCALALAGTVLANVTVIEKGEAITYPIKDGEMIECYAKMIDGSIDDFIEYNDNFKMMNGKLYSDTMQRIYKPEKISYGKKLTKQI